MAGTIRSAPLTAVTSALVCLFPLTSRFVTMLGHPAIRGSAGHGGLMPALVAGTMLWPALYLDMFIAAPLVALFLATRRLYRALA